MSDMATQYYEAFCSVNNYYPKHLLCSWHVDKAWKTALKEKIKNIAVEAETYLKLKTCLEVMNVDIFESSLEMLVNNLIQSNNTNEFGEYFATYMVPIRQKWGYCYRAGDGINTNMFVEAFHRNLKYNYLHGKHNKRVDNLLINL